MLSLYIHIPFCLHKCSYCDFFSIPVTEEAIPQRQYVDRLFSELATMVERYALRGRTVSTIFFGGGTPSMLAPQLLGEVLAVLPEYFSIAPDVEMTCEANPETLTLERLQGLRAAGINRLSMGVQSFHPHHLKFLERVHSADRAIAAAHDARRAGFANVNIDLIYGLPQQTIGECCADIAQAIALKPAHISAYHLTVEERTPLAVQVRDGRVAMPEDESVLAMWDAVRNRLARAGYPAYEISNHARPGCECRHNCNYWEYGEYLGLGTGACSFLKTRDPGPVTRDQKHDQLVTCHMSRVTGRPYALRFQRARNLHRYLAGELATDYEDPITRDMAMGECAFLALRTERGLSEQAFRGHFEISPIDRFGPQFTEWLAVGFLNVVSMPATSACPPEVWRDQRRSRMDRRWSLTPAGRRIANALSAQLV